MFGLFNEIFGEVGKKRKMRKFMGKIRKALTKNEVERKSSLVGKNLYKYKDYEDAYAVLFYAAKGNEVQTKKLVGKALKDGKNVLLPITDVHREGLHFAKINSYDDLREGAFGILEPEKKDDFDEELVDLIIVPGLAFDRQGNRLGHGFGFYDKLFRKLKMKRMNVRKLALAYDFQIVKNVPFSSNDERVDGIITESEVIDCR
jgi:5-formyltetrahydrofolate cyclo-ligase